MSKKEREETGGFHKPFHQTIRRIYIVPLSEAQTQSSLDEPELHFLLNLGIVLYESDLAKQRKPVKFVN